MSIDLEQVASYVGTTPDEPNLPALLQVADDLVHEYLGVRYNKAPKSVTDYATLQLVSELWTRRNAPGGVSAFADGQPIRLARDAMVSVRPLLDPYRGLGSVG